MKKEFLLRFKRQLTLALALAGASLAGRSGAMPAEGEWTSEPMDSLGAKFSRQGALHCAYSVLGATVNGIDFSRRTSIGESDAIAFAPAAGGFSTLYMNEGVSGDFGQMLGNGWFWKEEGVSSRTVTLTLKNLTAGKRYLVQILSHTMWDNKLVVSADGCLPLPVHGADEASCKYGVLLTGVFEAAADTRAVVVTFEGNDGDHPLNAVQVRELTEGGDDPTDPGEEDDDGPSDRPIELGWSVEAMTNVSDLVIEKQGSFLYGYRANATPLTVDGVTFAAGDDASNMSIAFTPEFEFDANSGNQFGTLLASSWKWANTNSSVMLTLNGLTKDKVYLVQILAHNAWGDPTITVGEKTPVYIGTGAKAANIVGIFKAEGTSADVELKFAGGAAYRMVNAIQVREVRIKTPGLIIVVR